MHVFRQKGLGLQRRLTAWSAAQSPPRWGRCLRASLSMACLAGCTPRPLQAPAAEAHGGPSALLRQNCWVVPQLSCI